MSSSYTPPSSQVGSVVSSVMSSQNVQEAGRMAQETARDVQKNWKEGHWSLHLLALLGALAMIVFSVLTFVSHIVMLHWISAVFDVYTFFLGIIIVILESGQRLSVFQNLEKSLYNNALFLKYVWGRGVVYFVAGSLMMSKQGMVDLAVGGYVCVIGALYVVVGRQASTKLADVRRSSCTPEQIQEAFAKADIDGMGSLTIDQFQQLTTLLGVDLNRQEAEAAFMQIDYSRSGRLTYESVQMWWNEAST